MKLPERTLRAYVALSFRRPWALLAAFLIPTVLAGWYGFGISIVTDLATLLPEDAPSVRALRQAERRSGSTEYYVIAVESPDPLANVRFVDALAERIRTWDSVQSVEIEQNREFFRDHALLYLPVSDLERIRDNLKRLVRRELAEKNPLFVDLTQDRGGAEGEPRENAVDEFTDWRNPDVWVNPNTWKELGLAEEQVEQFVRLGAGEDAESEPLESPTGAARRALPDEYSDYLISPEGDVAVLMARMTERSTDITFARRVYEEGVELIEELEPASYHPELHAEVVGGFRSFLEVKAITQDVAIATSISIGLVLLLVAAFFRSFRSVVIVLLPLIVGVLWTLGLIRGIYGQLNTMTAFVFSMLIGMGIDFGIHLYDRARENFLEGESWEEAARISLLRTGRALATASLTTIVALLTLTMAHFSGFVEFGITCALGIALCFIATCSMIPVLVAVTERVRPLPRHGTKRIELATPPHRTSLLRVTMIVIALLAVYGALSLPEAKFEYDFRNLRGSGTGQTIKYGGAVGRARSSTPGIILGESEEQMREVHAELRERLVAGDEMLKSFVTIETFVPSTQDERMSMINEIYEVLDRRAVQNIGGDEGRLIRALTDLTDVEPFEADELPEWSRRVLTEVDGSFGRVGLLYGTVAGWDAREVADFQDRYQQIEVPSGTALIATSKFILTDVISYVKADGKRLAFYVAIALTLILLLDLRSIPATLACLATLLVAVLLTAAVMVAYDIRLGLYNMVVLPTVLGVGIDGAIHMYHRAKQEGPRRIWNAMRTTGVAIAASSVTTAAGFFGLMLIDHRGVATIGQLAVTGVLASLVAVLGFLPGVLTFIRADADRGARGSD